MLQLFCSISKNYTLSLNSERVFLCLNYKIIFNQPSISTRAKLCGDIVTLPSANREIEQYIKQRVKSFEEEHGEIEVKKD